MNTKHSVTSCFFLSLLLNHTLPITIFNSAIPKPLLLNTPLHVLFPLLQRNAESRSRTDPLTLPYKDERNDADQTAQTAKKRTRTGDPEAAEHGRAREREDSAEDGSSARGSGVGRCSKDLIGVGDIIQLRQDANGQPQRRYIRVCNIGGGENTPEP